MLPRFYKPHYVKGGLVLYLPMDKIVGGKVLDVSGYKNHGTVYGAVIADGIRGQALYFDGVDDYVDCGNDESLNITDEITVSAWVKPFDSSHNMRVVSRSGTGNNMGYTLLVTPSTDSVTLWLNNGTWQELTVENVISTNKWWHIVATYDGNNRKIYVNGEVKKTDGGIGTIKGGSSPFNIGRRYETTTEFYNGLIDEVRIYNRALSEGEIKYNYLMSREIMKMRWGNLFKK